MPSKDTHVLILRFSFRMSVESKISELREDFMTFKTKVRNDLRQLNDQLDKLLLSVEGKPFLKSKVLALLKALQQAILMFEENFAQLDKKLEKLLTNVPGKTVCLYWPPAAKKSKLDGEVANHHQPKAEKSNFDTNDNRCFQYDEDGYVIVYTDGACSRNGKLNPKAGCGVFWGEGHSLNKSFEASRATNNAAEIEACTEAIKIATQQKIKKLLIKTDSKFTKTCMDVWIYKWMQNGWKKKDGSDVQNRVELLDLYEAIQAGKKADPDFRVKFKHVRGHNGEYGNERADELAKQGKKKY